MNKGLTSGVAHEKLLREGFNELPSPQRKNLLALLKEIAQEPMFLLLIACGTLYLILGDTTEGIVMICMISIIIGITYFQHKKTEKALEALRKLSSPRALVFRDNEWTRIPGREVVTDDLVSLQEGDRVPADGVLDETTGISCDESIITGESYPVDKQTGDKLLSGTLVTRGNARMIVTNTGLKSEFGKIGTSLNEIEDKQTALQTELKRFIRKVAIAGVVICIVVVILFFLTRGNFLQALLNGLAAAMAILPEEFPVVLTVFLALGAWRLSKKNVLTRKAASIENLGSATVLCTDKTGTLTENKMTISRVSGIAGETFASFTPTSPEGRKILEIAALASHPAGSEPMEKAILDLVGTPNYPELVREYPLNHEHLAISRVYGSTEKKCYSKGAPETILSMCGMEPELKERILAEIKNMAAGGLRVIGVAGKEVYTSDLPEHQKDLKLDFLGLIGFSDPVRVEVPDAISLCHRAGVKVIMITGDYPETAKNIGATIGLNTQNVLTGADLDGLNDEELTLTLEQQPILARIRPEQKLRIVRCLQGAKETVAMTGDGVNDAPALKAADIGIAMGLKGTDVAREASSLVLLDDNFASIVEAIRLGRRIYDNLRKAMSYILAIHVPIIGLTMIPAFNAGFPILLMPLHIIFMELIIDPVSSIAFETEEEEKGIMDRPPRPKDKTFFGGKRIGAAILEGLLLLITVLATYLYSLEHGKSTEELRAIAYFTLVLGNIFLIFSKLSYTRTFAASLFGHNRSARIILLVALSVLFFIMSVPGVKDLFKMDIPAPKDLIAGAIFSLIMLGILETIKLVRLRRFNAREKVPE